jgi:hypothetical protein
MLRLAAEEKRGPEKRELGKRDGASLRAPATMGGGQQPHLIVAVQCSGCPASSRPRDAASRDTSKNVSSGRSDPRSLLPARDDRLQQDRLVILDERHEVHVVLASDNGDALAGVAVGVRVFQDVQQVATLDMEHDVLDPMPRSFLTFAFFA